jgi:tetratricopeptide (TPR) repeat protein
MRLSILTLVLSSASLVLAGEPPPATPDVETLCTQLGSESYDAREAAHRALLALGRQAKERLQLLQETSQDAEVVYRSTAILRDITERERMEDLFGRNAEATHTEEELAEAKALAQQLEEGGVQHRNKVYEELGPAKLPRMVEAMRAWMRSNPKDGNVAYNLGYTLFWMERNREAAAVWLYTETIAPGEDRAFNDAAIALERDGRFDEAVAQYEKTMKRFPDFAHPVCDLAALKATMGDHKAALELYQTSQHMRSHGDSGTSHEAVLAEYLANNGRLQEADQHFEAAFAKPGERIYTFGTRFDVLHIHGRFEEMKNLTADAAQEFPNHSTVLLMQAVLTNATGDRTKAQTILDQLIAQRGETDSLRRRKAWFLMGTEHYQEAGAIIKRLLEQNPRDPSTLAAATSWARGTKRWREAVEYATARTRLLPGVPDAHAELATIYATADDPKIRNLERARDLASVAERLMAKSYYYGTARLNRAELDAELSHVYEADGKWAEALARYRALAELYPWSKERQERLAKLAAATKEH